MFPHKIGPPILLRKLYNNIFAPIFLTASIAGLFLLFTSCNDSSQTQKPYAYIGGEIVNPTTNFIVIKKNGKVIDSLPLNEKNKFSLKIDSAEAGLYIIQHRPEAQNFYLSPGDSLLMRVNTMAFDESLHFSGKGDAQNNFMTEMYLLDEANADLLLSFYKTKPSVFLKKTDSIRGQRLETLKKMKEKYNFSSEFVELAKNIIDYESFDLKERYTYLINKYYKEYSKNMPEDFHDYRKEVRFNEESLQSNPGYKRFIENYLINKSFRWCSRQNFDVNDCYDLTDTENVKSRIQMVGKLIHIPSLKEYFLSKLGSMGIIMAKSREDILDIIKELEKSGFSEEGIKDMNQLGSIQMAFLPGTVLKNVPIINTKGDSIPFKEVVEKPTIIFLWSIYKNNHQEDHELIQELRVKYPEINFIGINMDAGETSAWRIATQKYGYDQDFEYQLGPTRIDSKFFKYYLNKLLFLDASGKVIIGDAFINSPEFESRILEFLNR